MGLRATVGGFMAWHKSVVEATGDGIKLKLGKTIDAGDRIDEKDMINIYRNL